MGRSKHHLLPLGLSICEESENKCFHPSVRSNVKVAANAIADAEYQKIYR